MYTATTGTAAFLLQGSTINSALKLGRSDAYENNNNNESKQNAPSGQSKKEELQANWKNVLYLIIDETSMLGLQMLARILKKLFIVKCKIPSCLNFSGIQNIFVGDFLQHVPVKQIPLYK